MSVDLPDYLIDFVILSEADAAMLASDNPEAYANYIALLAEYFSYIESPDTDVEYKADAEQTFEDVNVSNPIKEQFKKAQAQTKSEITTEILESLSDTEFNSLTDRDSGTMFIWEITETTPEDNIYTYTIHADIINDPVKLERIEGNTMLARQAGTLTYVTLKDGSRKYEERNMNTLITIKQNLITKNLIGQLPELKQVKLDKFKTRYNR
mgnify:CR=1 FL=1|jgi:hypothetical protein|tara:strand:- start:720 stop:1349 length:630 start_codon:yes stop_codon:yes gene_type:complete